MSKQYKLVSCTINGKQVEKMVDVRASLTDMLRDDYRLTSVKKGCEVGECGACNVIIDGECFNSCIYLAVWAQGKEILTLEGLAGSNGEISDIQQAFIDEAAVQCGFCSPGFIMSAMEILEAKREFSDDEIRKLMSGHLCRCTGYENIFRAVKKTMLRRLGKGERQLAVGDVSVRLDSRQALKGGQPVTLTVKEFDLLVELMRNRNIALYREQLYEKVWKEPFNGETRTLDSHIQRLRKKLGWEDRIRTVFRIGYRLEG